MNLKTLSSEGKTAYLIKPKKKFKPHVTILRKPVYGKEGRMVHMSIEPESLVADRILLMSSTRGKNGMIYKEIGSVSAQ